MLKFSGIEVGARIRAYDFKPMGDRPDSYVEGVIVEDMVFQGSKVYRVTVDFDSVFEDARPERSDA